MTPTNSKISAFYEKYKHGIPLITYIIIYISWFGYLEKTVTKKYQVIHMPIDDHIPFCEIFVVPYFLWFAYVAMTVLFFFFKNKSDYYKAFAFLTTGMTIFLIISTLWPNGHHLRPYVMPRDNIFTQWIVALYSKDTATNLWPSIHVYNSLGVHFAIAKSKTFEHYKFIRIASFILSASIVASTVLIKQHSMFDVLTAFALAAIMYTLIYHYDLILTIRMIRNKKKARPQIS